MATTKPKRSKGIKGALTRKFGPLPAWAWALIAGALLYWYRSRNAPSATQQAAATNTGSTGGTPTVLDPGQSIYDPGTGGLQTAPGGGGSGDNSGGGSGGTDPSAGISAIIAAITAGFASLGSSGGLGGGSGNLPPRGGAGGNGVIGGGGDGGIVPPRTWRPDPGTGTAIPPTTPSKTGAGTSGKRGSGPDGKTKGKAGLGIKRVFGGGKLPGQHNKPRGQGAVAPGRGRHGTGVPKNPAPRPVRTISPTAIGKGTPRPRPTTPAVNPATTKTNRPVATHPVAKKPAPTHTKPAPPRPKPGRKR